MFRAHLRNATPSLAHTTQALGSNKTWALRLHIPNHPLQLQLDTFNTLQSLNDLASINLDFPLKKYT